MQLWKVPEAKNRASGGATKAVQAGWLQSSNLVHADSQGSTSSNGRHFRQFQSPDAPPSWLGNGNQRDTASCQFSSDEDEDETLIITRQAVTARKPGTSIQLNQDGWYDWDIDPLLSHQHDARETATHSHPVLEPSSNTSKITRPPRVEFIDLDIEKDSETVDITFLEDFDKSLEEVDSISQPSIAERSSVASEQPPSPQVVLLRSASPGNGLSGDVPVLDHYTPVSSEIDDSESKVPGLFEAVLDAQLEAVTREELEDFAGHQSTEQNERTIAVKIKPANTSSSLPDEVDASPFDYSAALETVPDEGERWLGPEDDASPAPLQNEQTHDFNDEGDILAVPPIPSIEHSRAQSQRLRLYSTLYADFARDPWKWHERRDIVNDMFPSLESEDVQAGENSTYRDSDMESDGSSRRMDHQWELEDKYGRPHRRNEGWSIEERGGSSSSELRRLDRTAPLESGRRARFSGRARIPLEGQKYCQQCRRHFKNTWRMQKHLADSRLHPYYCQVCTVDFGSFQELFMHYAEHSKCRPPELEFGPAKPFLQILADYQTTGRKEAARKRSAADAGQALKLNEDRAEVLEHAENCATPGNNLNLNQNLEPPVCPICMIPLMKAKEVLATACGHVYCSSCILHYFSKERPNCPKCRTPVSKATLIPIQLH